MEELGSMFTKGQAVYLDLKTDQLWYVETGIPTKNGFLTIWCEKFDEAGRRKTFWKNVLPWRLSDALNPESNAFDDRYWPEEKVEDKVNKPAHYQSLNHNGVECIDAIKSMLTPEEFRGYLKGNALKYFWRHLYKGKPEEDLDKHQVYINWYRAELKGKEDG